MIDRSELAVCAVEAELRFEPLDLAQGLLAGGAQPDRIIAA